MSIDRIKKVTGGRRLTYVIAVSSVALTMAASLASTTQVQVSADKELRARALNARELVDRRIRTYGEVLYGTSALRTTTPALTRRKFNIYIASMEVLRRYQGVQVIGFGEVVRGDRASYEKQAQQDIAASGLPYFRTPTERFSIDTGKQQPPYAPISFIEPQATNQAALGFDFLDEPNRRAALERARDTGNPAATAPVTLVQETGDQLGFLLMLATYRADTPPTTVAERRKTFIGVEYAAFRMGDLLSGVLGQEASKYALEVYDRGEFGSPRPLPLSTANRTYDTDSRADALTPGGTAGTRVVDLNVAGRRWDIHYRATAPLVSAQERAAPWMIGGLGLLLSVLATWVFWMMSTARERALCLAEAMTTQLRESERQLARSNHELERFAYVASHDLQEPLRTVSSFVGLLNQRYGNELDERAKRYIAFAVDGTGRMSRMISELLTYSRVGRMDSDPTPTDLAAAWDEAVDNLRGSIHEAEAQITRGRLPVVLATRLHAVQVFQNLISNALKYRSPEPPKISAEAKLIDDEQQWLITIRDNGIGIDPRHHERIFVIFQRLHTTEEYPGTGMGLSICKKIIESYGGHIWVESEPGAGAQFHIQLPVLPAEPGARPDEGSQLVGAR